MRKTTAFGNVNAQRGRKKGIKPVRCESGSSLQSDMRPFLYIFMRNYHIGTAQDGAVVL